MSTEISHATLKQHAEQNGLAGLVTEKQLKAMLFTASKSANPIEWLDTKAAEFRTPPAFDEPGPDPPTAPAVARPKARVDHAHRPICARCTKAAGEPVYMRAASSSGNITYYYCPNTPTGQGRLQRELRDKFIPSTTTCNEPGIQVTRGRAFDPAVEAARRQRTEVGFAAREGD